MVAHMLLKEMLKAGFTIKPQNQSPNWGVKLPTATSYFDLLLSSGTPSATFDANGSEVKAFTLTVADMECRKMETM